MNCICPVVWNPTGAEAYPTAVFWAPHTAVAVSNKEVSSSTLWPARWASIAAEYGEWGGMLVIGWMRERV